VNQHRVVERLLGEAAKAMRRTAGDALAPLLLAALEDLLAQP
jgi:hypothetical protein